ncbi:DNA cytosine methyltransferase [Winogradskyella damuponensis]|uniref:Cytosine-specific methyltransferase n=1 Tax=Winogradskyella damuponensis TaxID=943939 RepID=A0ABP8CPH1_9FLAO
MKKKTNKITFIDLFAGCGGLSEGFLQSGRFDALAHVEWDLPMVNTLRNRLKNKWKHSNEDANKRVIHFDIQKVKELIYGEWEEETIKSYGGANDKLVIDSGLMGLVGGNKVDLIIGGPPCQAYSIAGRAQNNLSMQNDYRNYLFESFISVVHTFQPKLFVFENVPGMLSAKPGGKLVTERVYESFKEHNYEILEPKNLKSSILTSSDFGVPQERNRVIIIGIRKDLKTESLNLETIYSEINKQKRGNKKSVFDAIGHLPKFKPLNKINIVNGRRVSHAPMKYNDASVRNHIPRFHNERDIKIFREWISNNMNKCSTNERIKFYNDMLGKDSKHGKYRNLEWDMPSKTIVAHLQKDGLLFIHPDANQARSITVKEAALIQSFPDDFEFIETMGYNYKMIGNAVPPLMAKKIAIAIAEVIQDSCLNKKFN